MFYEFFCTYLTIKAPTENLFVVANIDFDEKFRVKLPIYFWPVFKISSLALTDLEYFVFIWTQEPVAETLG